LTIASGPISNARVRSPAHSPPSDWQPLGTQRSLSLVRDMRRAAATAGARMM